MPTTIPTSYREAARALRALVEAPGFAQEFLDYLKALPADTTAEIADPHACYLCRYLRRCLGFEVVTTNLTVYIPFGTARDSAELPCVLREWFQALAVRRPGDPPVFWVKAARAAVVLERMMR